MIIGKTHLSEFGAYPVSESATWGVTRNPWDLYRTPGGSSGGSAAAVASGMVPGATGSDSGGSVRIPAACCGLVGLKGQRGRISTKESPERAYRFHGLNHIGPLARSVMDAALLHDAMTGPEPDDEIPSPEMARTIEAARRAAVERRIAGKAVTPFLLERIVELTAGASLRTNVALVENNARLAARIAAAL